jgi:hypothetical protein
MISKVAAAIQEVKPCITCKVKKEQQIYVSATGNVAPCCWLDLEWKLPKEDSRIDYMDKVGKFPSLHNITLEEIFNSGYFNEIEQTWSNSPLIECSKQCGSFDRLGEQYVN